MIRLKKVTAVLLSALLVSSCMAPCTFAASKTKVGKINLTIDTDIRSGSSGGEVEVTPTGDNTEYFYIDSVEVTNDEGDDWSKSNPPEAEIRIGLEDEDEYTFSGSSSSNFKLTLASSIKSRYDKVEYVSARKTDGGATIILNIRLVFDKDADMSNAAAPGSVEWSASSEGTATWGDVSSAKYFQVQLYKDGNLVTPPDGSASTVSVYGTSYDFSSWVSAGSKYTFKVRSVKSQQQLQRANGYLPAPGPQAPTLPITIIPTPSQKAGRKLLTASAGGGKIQMVPTLHPSGRKQMENGTISMRKATWLPDGSMLAA